MEALIWLANLKSTEPTGWHLVIENKAGELIRLQPISPNLAAYLKIAGLPLKEYSDERKDIRLVIAGS